MGKLKMIKGNTFKTDCKNELAVFTRCISFTGPLFYAFYFQKDNKRAKKLINRFFQDGESAVYDLRRPIFNITLLENRLYGYSFPFLRSTAIKMTVTIHSRATT